MHFSLLVTWNQHHYSSAIQQSYIEKAATTGSTRSTYSTTYSRFTYKLHRQENIFKEPRIEDDKRLDWCLSYGWYCGLPVATAFCRWKGHYYACDWGIDLFVGNTKLIGTGNPCQTPLCSGFKYIECTNED